MVDIGGTALKAALLTREGQLIGKQTMASRAPEGACSLMEQVEGVLEQQIRQADIAVRAVGIATAGQVDARHGRILYATDIIPGYTGTEVGQRLSERLHLPVAVENDVNAAAMGEMAESPLRSKKHVILLTIGTGIGGALVEEGKVLRGAWGSAGEIGHIILEVGGRPCTCGSRGCFEQYASATALVRDYAGAAQEQGLPAAANARDIFDRMRQGEETARACVERFYLYLAAGITGLVHILNPEVVVLGGGISKEGATLTNGVWPWLQKFVMPSFLNGMVLSTASMGNDACLYGVGRAAFELVEG